MTEPFSVNEFRRRHMGAAGQSAPMPQASVQTAPHTPAQYVPQPHHAGGQPVAYASPQSVPTADQEPTKKRGRKAKRDKGEKRRTSPALIFMMGMVVGGVGAVFGLSALGNMVADKTDQKFKEIAAERASAPTPETPAELSDLQNQLKLAEGLNDSAKSKKSPKNR